MTMEGQVKINLIVYSRKTYHPLFKNLAEIMLIQNSKTPIKQ
jgi:hypothetical protein